MRVSSASSEWVLGATQILACPSPSSSPGCVKGLVPRLSGCLGEVTPIDPIVTTATIGSAVWAAFNILITLS